MKQKFSNFSLNGQVQFSVYDENNLLLNKFNNKNSITVNGINAYKNILSAIRLSHYPYSDTRDDEDQTSLLSNYVQFNGMSGQVPFLKPLKVINKSKSKLVNAFKDNQDVDTFSYINNKNSFWKNSDNKTTFINNTVNRWCYVYQVGDNSTDYNQLHTGIRIDILGSNHKRNYFRIAYQFQDKIISKFTDITRSTFPLVNGKPLFKQYTNYYGMQLKDDQIYTYFFDMYPRYSKIPKKIIFIFQGNRTANQVSIDKIQFITHRQPKIGPLGIYISEDLMESSSSSDYSNSIYDDFSSSDSSCSDSSYECNKNIFVSPITKCIIRGNSLYYYSKIDYNQANGLNINYAGLCNSFNNIVYEEDSDVNIAYDSINKRPYFYKQRFANAQECNNWLTNTSYNFVKTNKNRIDILYKINIQFGL